MPDQKCLDCHVEINQLITEKRGYHASVEVKNKTCIDCHSEHHGRKFDVDRFDVDNFNHDLTGYALKGKHKKVDCRACHAPENISNPTIKKLEGTYLGMGTACIDCHDDYHQGTLNTTCTKCHTEDGWKPVTSFDHSKTNFPLLGAHQNVECIECHKQTTRNGKPFQEFKIPFAKCTDCHDDAHDGAFGQRCTDCHQTSSWQNLKSKNPFDHSKTDYPLLGLHKNVDCKACHKAESYLEPIAHAACKNCHSDYHRGEFTRKNPQADCQQCHSVYKDFTATSYGLEEHNRSNFPLVGGHAATPCFACHVSEDKWTFRSIGERCIDCHDDVHAGKISAKYYPDQDCEVCHSPASWSDVLFEHDQTGYPLLGQHAKVDCRNCHFSDDAHQDIEKQQFSFADKNCVQCHTNVHGNQFEKEGKTTCTDCHNSFEDWAVITFDHNTTRFPLEGKHKEAACSACHVPELVNDQMVVIYKIKQFECADCHSL